jgi:hypothetical protein
MANAYDKRFLLLKRVLRRIPRGSAPKPADRQIDLLHLNLAYNIEPAQWKYSEIKIRRTLSQPFDKPREDYHGSIIARGEAKSPDSLRRHKRYCRESNFEVFQPFRMANASSSARKKYYQLFSNVDTEAPRFPGL